MANVKVAVRVRPPNAKEAADGGRLAVQVDDKFVRIQNVKLDGRTDHTVDSREKLLEFCFDYCYWSVHPEDPHYASQEEVFQDLGESVLAGASEGYNVCLFAYGQTGSGKTYTMMGTPDSIGLTPRICQGLFWSDNALPDGQNSSRVEISFLEIYNERVRDLLRVGEQKKRAALRVREHPEKGPYVQDLSQHVVSDSKQAMVLLEEGIANRITAATHNHDASSRSHAIFTIQYTQAILENNRPSETVSKINLVDLAGSERADHNYCRDRLTEGSNINKSLVTLGIVISALAQNSQMSSSCQSINSMASEGDKSTAGSHSSSLSRGGGRRSYFIPYRDSVLTWLLKDSLGGNSKTIMIATVSPSANSYNETLSTLRYAAHARNIINKPRVNEDANVRLIRELREEIDRLKSMLLTYELQRNPSPSLSDERDGALSEIVLQNELKVEQLMKDWSESWIDQKCLLQQYNVDINSVQPHLISLDRDALSTGIVFYNLLEGITRLGPGGQSEEPQIVLQGSAGCEIVNHEGVVTLRPLPDCICLLNEREINEPYRLAQGAVITLGGVHRFLFNHPTEAAVLREQKRGVESNVPCTVIDLCVKGDNHSVEKAKLQGQPPHCTSLSDQTAARQRVEQQQRYVESLLQDINCEQRKAEKELEQEQALLQQQHRELQAWIHQEKERLSTAERRATQELGVQTDLVSIQLLDQFSSFVAADQNTQVGICPSQLDREKKKVVNEELMKHHALCRAASRIHRSRLQFQLKRIANKRCMLEAKRELQRLEKALPSGPEGLDSAEFGSKCSGDSFALRRHSFTSDLLSRLHPHHSSRHALKGNQHTTSTTSMCSRTWVSDECLPRGRTQSCSGSLFSGQSQFCQDEVHLSANIPAKDQPPVPRLKCPERKPLLPNRDLTFKNWSNTSPSVTPSSPLSTAGQKTNKENSLSITKKESLCVAASPESLKTKCDALNSRQGTTEELSSSVRPKKNFSMVFRRPELSHEERGPTFLRRIMGRLHWRQRRGLGLRRKRTGSKCPMKSAVSCDDLDQRHLFQGFGQRRWHSTEALRSQTKRWVETQPELTGWDEEEKEVNWDEERSDCDSLFSLDSLSSTYAAALADQLKSTEDTWGCGAESEDSSMSKDSLTVVSRQKCTSMKKLSKALLPTPLIAQEVSPHQKYRKLESVLGNHGASALLSPPATDLRNSESGTIKITLNFPGKKSDSWSSPVSSRTRMDSQNREMLKDAEIGPQMTPLDSLGRLKHGDMTSNSKVFPSVPATSTDLNITNSVKAKERSKPLQEFLLKTEDQSSAVEVRVVRYESSSERHPTVKKTSEPPEVEIGKHPIETSVCSTGSFCATHSCTNSSEIMYDSGCCMKLPTDDHNPDDSAEDVNQYELPNDILLSGDEKLDEISHKCPMSCLTLNAVNSACEDTLARNKEEQQQAFTGSIGIPKRQNSKDVLTHCSTPAGTCNRVWLNVSDSSRDPEWDQTPVAIDDVSPDGRHDSLASVGLPVSDLISLKFVEVSNKPTTSEESFPSCKHGNKVHECTVATKEAPEKIKGIESYDSKPHHISQSQAICSAIDLRISEVVKEHVRLPVIGSNDERITHAGHRPFQSSTCPFCCDCDEHRRTDEQPKADSRVTSVCGHCSLDQNKQMITCNEIDHRMLSNAPAIKSVITDMKSNEPPNRLNDAKLLFKFHHESRDTDCGLSNAPKVGQEKEHLNLTKSRVCFKSAVKQSCCEASVLNPNSSHNLSATGVNSCGEFLDPSAAKEESSPEQGQNPVVMSDQLEKGNEPQHNFPATNVNNDDKWSNVPQQEVDQRTNRKGVVGHDDLINQSEYVTHNQFKNGGKSCHGSDIAMIHSSGSTCGHSAPKIVRSRWSRRKSGSSHPSRSSCYDTSSDEQDDETPKHRRNSRPLSPNVNPDLCISQPCFNDTVKSPKSRKKNPCISSNTRKRHCLRPKHSQKQVCERETDEGKAAVGSQESIMHFASSDINPFVHHRQDSSQQCNNTQAFGSAADLSCKSLLLNSTEKRIMRCCSADDGLNGQNSPFLSHLSTYANNKRLSSTLSSFEDCQVKKEFAQHKSNGSHCQGGETTARTKGSTGFSPSSSQVDEIMFLYSSETESNKTKAIRRTNECGSQTEYNWHRGLPLRGERHKRSVTEGAATKKVDIKETPTWASMESMSVHLSKLIDSTSDLLGDVQGMRTGGVCTSVNLPEINVSKRKLNSFTQTSTMDTSNPRTCSDCPRTHEVNVTVRVVGAEVFTVAQNRNGRHVVASRVTAKNENLREVGLNSSTETPPVMSETNRERQVRCAPREGPLTEEPRNKRVSENTELGRRASFSNKDAHYTDRASSPIITVGSNTLTRPKVKHSNANYQKGNGSEAQLVYPYDQSSKEEWDISSLGIDPKPLESEISYPSPKKCFGSLPSSLGGYKETERSRGVYQDFNRSLTALFTQEDDIVSLAPSECNTDVLVNAQPIICVQTYPGCQTVPDDLPVHNKFTNWSGIPSEQTQTKMVGSGARRCSQLIERLRRERHQVLATVNMKPLTTEQTEANSPLKKDAGFREELQPQPQSPTKQQLYDRHRRSIEGLRQEREDRLQTSRRARSLSPRRHSRLAAPETCPSSTMSMTISNQHQDYLQPFHRKVMSNTRMQAPCGGEGQHPSVIEQLLQDYGRAQEEAKTEIARARERLRERTEQEKRRFLQQASHQAFRDEPKLRTRISNSTLCTGSSVSLSSGPTSGYNSGNTFQHGSRPVLTGQAMGFQEEEHEVSTCPSPCVKGQPSRLSAQDLTAPDPRRKGSFECSRYKDITCNLLDRIFAEVRLAAPGGLINLLKGEATAGWRYQGQERGVQSFYKPSSPSVHSFLAAAELERPLESLWGVISQPSRTHVYHPTLSSVWTRPLDDSTQLVYMLTDSSFCHLDQPRDFCCISKAVRQGGLCVLAMQSVFEESLPRPCLDAVRAEMLPSCWLLQPVRRSGKEVTRIIGLLQVDLGFPSIPPHLLNTAAMQQASVISHLNSYLDTQL